MSLQKSMSFNHIINLIKSNDTALKVLDLKNYELGDQHVRELAEALKQNTTLNQLFLNGDKFSVIACTYLMDVLEQGFAPKMEIVDIGWPSANSPDKIETHYGPVSAASTSADMAYRLKDICSRHPVSE